MNSLLVLIPVTLLVVVIAVVIFFWAVNHQQFDDLDSPAFIPLLDDPDQAATCSTTIQANDMMRFNKSSIQVPKTCKHFTVTLKHTGTLPKAAMGHDWVLSRTADEAGILSDGANVGLDEDYIKPNDKRVIAHTKIIGGGLSASTTFKVSALKAGDSYSYFCSFPGHAALMHGTLTEQIARAGVHDTSRSRTRSSLNTPPVPCLQPSSTKTPLPPW